MNNPFANRSLDNARGFVAVTADELTHVSGGGLWSWIKDAASWVKDHIFVDFGSRIFGYKGTF
jgi:hypothetical protein